MGREIRHVPANWEHPKDQKGYIPLYDDDFETVARKWLDECIAWDNGTHPGLLKYPEHKEKYPFYWMYYGNPPDKESYRPKFTEEPTWYQMYETVTEGTPVTPAFATKEELVEYLVKYGDSWDQLDHRGGWSRQNAERFVATEWAPSLIAFVPADGTTPTIKAPRDGA